MSISETNKPNYDTGRRSGRTTRIVDELVSRFFEFGVAECYDHHEPDEPTKVRMRTIVMRKVYDRIINEHNFSKQHIRINEPTFTLHNLYFHVHDVQLDNKKKKG